jgi:hypothetical protein
VVPSIIRAIGTRDKYGHLELAGTDR